MRRWLLAVALLATTRCAFVRPVDEHVSIELRDDHEHARVVAETKLAEEGQQPRTRARVAAAREALVAGRDPWSVRFDRLKLDDERLVIDKKYGVVQRVEHAGTVARDDLPRLFADADVTVQLARGDGWSELTIYPAASTRATRAQRDHLAAILDRGAHLLADYYDALQHLYAHLDVYPQRAELIFRALYEEDGVIVTDEEAALVNSVRVTSDAVMALETDSDAYTITDEADLVYNPFSADISIKLPSPVLSATGFERKGDSTVTITRPTLIDAVVGLENRWAAPDILALSLRASHDEHDPPTPVELAALRRHAAAGVTAAEVRDAIVQRMQPPNVYRVRWSE